VLLNRRGWSNFVTCRACGHAWGCPHCDVALVLHRADHLLACHHCGHRERIPGRCACGSTSLARHGAGTERLEHDLTAALGDGGFPVFRLDADVRGAGRVLRAFERAPAGVLIGTQMVAKGHDFPDVALGVVLDADATLRFPDFRAEERTFALIAQLAGRAGRGGDAGRSGRTGSAGRTGRAGRAARTGRAGSAGGGGRGEEGRVLVQTIAPEARAIAHAARHDSDGFLAGELERRRALSYPPFSHLVRVVCAAAAAEDAHAAALELRDLLGEALEGRGAQVLGPAALMRLRGRERRALVIKAATRSATVREIGHAVQRAASSRSHPRVSFSVDVDPQ